MDEPSIKETFLEVETQGMASYVGKYMASSVGKFIRMGMTVKEKKGKYKCKHTIFGIPVAFSSATLRPESASGDTTNVIFQDFLLGLWCDEMKVLSDGSIVGRVVILPGKWNKLIKYFSYDRIGTS